MPLGTISSRASEYHAERYGNDRLTEPDLVSVEVVTLRPDSMKARGRHPLSLSRGRHPRGMYCTAHGRDALVKSPIFKGEIKHMYILH